MYTDAVTFLRALTADLVEARLRRVDVQSTEEGVSLTLNGIFFAIKGSWDTYTITIGNIPILSNMTPEEVETWIFVNTLTGYTEDDDPLYTIAWLTSNGSPKEGGYIPIDLPQEVADALFPLRAAILNLSERLMLN